MPIRIHPWLRLGFWLLPFAWLWFLLCNHLRLEWTLNPQCNYGWAVPFPCAYLLWQRVRRTEDGSRTTEDGRLEPRSENQPPSALCLLFFALAALLLLPARLILVANPQWRTAAWFVALVVIGLTLLAAHGLGVRIREIE